MATEKTWKYMVNEAIGLEPMEIKIKKLSENAIFDADYNKYFKFVNNFSGIYKHFIEQYWKFFQFFQSHIPQHHLVSKTLEVQIPFPHRQVFPWK